MDTTDSGLLKRWREDHDAEAFNQLVGRYAGLVYSAGKRLTNNDSEAEDVAQDCFLTLAQKPPLRVDSLGGWLHRVARNFALQRIRERKRRSLREKAAVELQPATQNIEWNEISAYIDDAIDKLPDDLRFAVAEHYLARRTHREIADSLGIPRQTVTSRLSKAVELIRADIKTRLGAVVSAELMIQQLQDNLVTAAPPDVCSELARIGLAGEWVSGARRLNWVTAGASAAGVIVAAIAAVFWLQPARSATTPPELGQGSTIESTLAQQVDVYNESTTADATVAAVAASTVEGNATASAQTTEIEAGEDGKSPTVSVQVSGVVSNEDGVVVPGAHITIVATGHPGLEIWPDAFKAFRDPRHQYVATTDAAGVFRVPNVGYPGNAGINVWAEGYANVHSHFLVPPEATPVHLNIILPRRGLLLKAQVLDPDGRPVPDAFVVAPTWVSDDGLSRSAARFFGRTDHDGRVQLGFVMNTGSWGTAGYAHVLVSSPTVGRASLSHVPIGKDSVVPLRIEPTATLVGTVAPSGPLGLTPKNVVLSEVLRLNEDGQERETGGLRDFGYTSTYMAPVDVDGRFTLKHVPPNRAFTVWVLDELGGDIAARTQITPLSPGETRTLHTYAGSGAVIRGTVVGTKTGRPLPRVRVAHGRSAWQIVDGERTWTDDHGNFTLCTSLLSDSVNLFAAYAFTRENEIERLASEFGQEVVLDGDITEGVELRIPDPVDVTVNTLYGDGTPVSGAAVLVLGSHQGLTDKHGNFTLALHPEYLEAVEVRKLGHVDSETEHRTTQTTGPVSALMTVTLYASAGGIEGQLINTNGTPLPNMSIRAAVTHESGVRYIKEGMTDVTGKFTLLEWCPAATYEQVSLLVGSGDTAQSTTLEDIELSAGEVRILDPITLE